MGKKINKILLVLKASVIGELALSAIFVLLGELDVFNDYVVDPHGEEEFILNSVAICLTILGIPLSIKFYTLCTRHALCRMNNDEALSKFLMHGVIRNSTFGLISVVDIMIYYLTMNIAGALCCLVVCVLTIIYCWPKRKQIDVYLEKVNQEE